jgi:hypothetical protein
MGVKTNVLCGVFLGHKPSFKGLRLLDGKHPADTFQELAGTPNADFVMSVSWTCLMSSPFYKSGKLSEIARSPLATLLFP